MSEAQICANSCAKAVDNQPCADCELTVVSKLRDSQTIRVLEQIEATNEKTDELTAPMLDQSANCVDLALFGWFALVLIIGVMWAFGQSKPVAMMASMCGGV